MKTKACTKCRKEYPATADFFPPDKRSRDGFHSWCRVCNRAATARWRAAYPEAARAYVARWQAAHPEAIRAANARWRAAHPEANRASKARWRAAHPESVKAHNDANYAIESGRLVYPDVCERCGKPNLKFDKHHPDYARPLDVVFLCRHCHALLHRKAVTCPGAV